MEINREYLRDPSWSVFPSDVMLEIGPECRDFVPAGSCNAEGETDPEVVNLTAWGCHDLLIKH
jgi:hypothetical protein